MVKCFLHVNFDANTNIEVLVEDTQNKNKK